MSKLDDAIKRAEKAEKEEEDRSALEASVIRRQSEAANKNFNSEAWANAPKSLIEQAKEYNNFSMLGGVHVYNGVEVDFGIGSVKADMLVSDSNTSPEDKIKYMAIVNDLNNSLNPSSVTYLNSKSNSTPSTVLNDSGTPVKSVCNVR